MSCVLTSSINLDKNISFRSTVNELRKRNLHFAGIMTDNLSDKDNSNDHKGNVRLNDLIGGKEEQEMFVQRDEDYFRSE